MDDEKFVCDPPKSCFECPYPDCTSFKHANAEEIKMNGTGRYDKSYNRKHGRKRKNAEKLSV